MTADDPLIRAIAESNPVSEADFADLPELRLPRRRASTRRRLIPVAAALRARPRRSPSRSPRPATPGATRCSSAPSRRRAGARSCTGG